MLGEVDHRDYELSTLRAQLARYQQANDVLARAVAERHDLTINGVIFRPIN